MGIVYSERQISAIEISSRVSKGRDPANFELSTIEHIEDAREINDDSIDSNR
jgi:hypothetical protein